MKGKRDRPVTRVNNEHMCVRRGERERERRGKCENFETRPIHNEFSKPSYNFMGGAMFTITIKTNLKEETESATNKSRA
jgi:hypothetical protein